MARARFPCDDGALVVYCRPVTEQANPDASPEAILASLQETLGLRFRTPELLREALTHASYLNERPQEATRDNQRLEFLGDAVLDLVVAHELYSRYPEAREGQLTAMRAAVVRTDAVARASAHIRLADHLLLGHGEEVTGGRTRSAILCAALEAVLGALFLDQGLDTAQGLVKRLFRDAFAALDHPEATRDPKSLLQEKVQAELHCTPVYRALSESGPDHAKEFLVEVRVGDRVLGHGRGPSKQAAEQAAARSALHCYPALPPHEEPPPTAAASGSEA
ncbi:MAG: ribonuclease III [Anaerolineae bacterium]